MKTKIISVLCFLFLLFNFKIQAQSWAPIGATWYYSYHASYFPPYLNTYSKIVSEKDTIINGVNCRKLIHYKAGQNGIPNYYKSNIYMYESDKKIYYHVDSLSRFCLLYDFNANAGGWWILDEYSGSALFRDTVKVISTDSITINGQKKKTMITQNTNFQVMLDGLNIEGIGNWFNMFPAFDMVEEYPLRCYQDNILGLYSTGVSSDCEFTNIGIEEYSDDHHLFISPNPAQNIIYVRLEGNKNDILISIINTKGQHLKSLITNKEYETIDISNLPAGLYFIQLRNNDKTVIRKLQITK